MTQSAPPRRLSTAMNSLVNFTAGGIAGFSEILIMHPMDLIKTRLQLQANSGMFAIMRSTLKSEGVLAFYKGLLPPLLAETPKRAVKFFTFNEYCRFFTACNNNQSGPVVFAAAGFCSGATEALVVNPFERVKVQLQADNQKFTERSSSWSVARCIVAQHGFGLRGLNLGLSATIARHSVWNCAYFGFYYSGKSYLTVTDNASRNFVERFMLGLFAGTLASCLNIPFDVVKSRLQGPEGGPSNSGAKYTNLWKTLQLVRRQEGISALYRGLLPKVLRLGPGGALMLIIFESVSENLTHYLLR